MRLLSVLIFILPAWTATCQVVSNDLRKDQVFFEKEAAEYVTWLRESGLIPIANFSNLVVAENKVTLTLTSGFATDDSLKVYWNKIQALFYKRNKYLLAEKLFNQFLFLVDVPRDRVAIIIRGKRSQAVRIKMSYADNLKVEENFSKAMAGGTINMAVKEIKFGEKNWLASQKPTDDQLVKKIRRRISDFLVKYYKDKGTYFYTAQIDTSKTFFNMFVYKISCLNHEIIPESHFEFIQYSVKIQKVDNNVSIQYDINGKYAAGIVCPEQRESMYKLIESSYPGKLEAYTAEMHVRITDLLKGLVN